MFFDTADKYLIKRQAWLEAIRLCGGVTAYSERMNVLRSRVSNWINQTEIEIPYQFAIKTSAISQVSIDRLSPFTESVNKMVRNFNSLPLLPLEIPMDTIVIDEQNHCNFYQEKQTVIIDTDGQLISGLAKVKVYKAAKAKQIQAIVLDLKSLLLEIETFKNIAPCFLISERVAIGFRLERLLGDRQGQRSDLGKFYKNHALQVPLRRICDEVKGRTDEIIAKKLSFSSKDTYRRAKQVYQHGILALIDALDSKQLSIAKATKIAKLPEELQLKQLQSYLKEKEEKPNDPEDPFVKPDLLG